MSQPLPMCGDEQAKTHFAIIIDRMLSLYFFHDLDASYKPYCHTSLIEVSSYEERVCNEVTHWQRLELTASKGSAHTIAASKWCSSHRIKGSRSIRMAVSTGMLRVGDKIKFWQSSEKRHLINHQKKVSRASSSICCPWILGKAVLRLSVTTARHAIQWLESCSFILST